MGLGIGLVKLTNNDALFVVPLQRNLKGEKDTFAPIE